MKILVTLALFAILLCTVRAAQECHGANEEFVTCGTACPDTCLNRSIRRPCIEICRQGCFCKQGFLRKGWDMAGGNGECVAALQCDSLIRAASDH